MQRVEQLLAERKRQLTDTETQLARMKVTLGANEQPATPERGHRKKPSMSLAGTSTCARPARPLIAHRLLWRTEAHGGDRHSQA